MSQEKRKNDVFRITAGIIVCCTLLCTLNSRITVVYRDAPLKELNTRISSGPAAGLMTSEEHAAQYAGILAVLEELNERYSPDNSVFITQLMPWGYLVTDFAYGAPTAWRTSLSSMRLQEYYEIYPDAVPEIVVVLEEHLGSFPDRPVPNANEYSGWFWNYLQQNAYTVEENEYASIYLASNVHEKEK